MISDDNNGMILHTTQVVLIPRVQQMQVAVIVPQP